MGCLVRVFGFASPIVFASLGVSLGAPDTKAELADLGYTAVLGVLVEFYEVEAESLPLFLELHKEGEDASGLLRKVQAEVEADRARLEESAYVATRVGQRAKIVSAREWIFPAEYQPENVPKEVTGFIDERAVISTPPTATAFAVREIGMTLEVDGVVDPAGQFVDLSIVPQRVEFHGNTSFGEDDKRVQPLFHSIRAPSSHRVRLGGSVLLGAYPSADGTRADKRVLGFASVRLPFVVSEEDAKDLPALRERAIARAKETSPSEVDPFDPEQRALPRKVFRQLRVVTECIEVDAALASKIARGIDQVADASSVRRSLDALIASGEARLLDLSHAITTSGQRAHPKSINEIIYPVEFSRPQLPMKVTGPIGPDVDLVVPVSASAFNMREVGFSVAVDPVIAAGGESFEVTLRSERVTKVGDLSYGAGVSKNDQPLFETLDLSTAVSIANGTTVLAGIHSLETARASKAATKEEQDAVRDRRVMVFITGHIKEVK